ncbi:MAG: AmmeMemoRadiSam system protein B [Pseudomonadota bacterium]|nr:AmmeMemoRadiSam system protein B [Pseudomonadota bacterium]
MKKRHLYLAAAIALVLVFAAVIQARKEPEMDAVRPAAVAGKFYSNSPTTLRAAIAGFLEDATPVTVSRPLALVLPHAGYIYSGQIAADGYNQARGHRYDTVVILGTNHTTPGFHRIGLYPGDGFATPLGVARVDKRVVEELLAASPDCVRNASVHEREHSVEVQVPFIQTLFPDAKIVPAIVGSPEADLCRRFGRALGDVLKDRKALVVASSDLSHYPAHAEARSVDIPILEAIPTLDTERVRQAVREAMGRGIRNLHTAACGEGPILVAMSAAQAMGAKGGKAISYANSGDVAIGDLSRVVGYGAAALTADVPATAGLPPPPAGPAGELSSADKRALLGLARKSIARYLATETVPLARGFSPAAQEYRGVFVTLKKRGQLRGCIGRLVPEAPLCRLVGAMAIESAFNDHRFRPVTAAELKEIEIELSVLTPMKRVPRAEDIVVGRDGVLLQKGRAGAVFLPQVATEQGWGREEMLDQLCLKAGLPVGSWRAGAEFQTFQAMVFHESDFR